MWRCKKASAHADARPGYQKDSPIAGQVWRLLPDRTRIGAQQLLRSPALFAPEEAYGRWTSQPKNCV